MTTAPPPRLPGKLKPGAHGGIFDHEAEGRTCEPQPRPYQRRPHERFGPAGSYPRMGQKHRVSFREDHRVGVRTTPLAPDAEFPWLTIGEVDSLTTRLVEQHQILPWLKPWQRREILREHLREVGALADTTTEQQPTSTRPYRWNGPVMTMTQKRR